METVIKVRQAEKALRRSGQVIPANVVIIDAPPGLEYPKAGRGMRMFVASQLRTLLASADGPAILALFCHDKHPIIAGETEEKNVRTEYGFDGSGPVKMTYRRRKELHSKWELRSVDMISPEEFMAHIKYPQEFFHILLGFLDAAANKVLQQSGTGEHP
jgi:hypothetical protein